MFSVSAETVHAGDAQRDCVSLYALRRPPVYTLFPYATLFRSQVKKLDDASAVTLPYPYWHQRGFEERNPDRKSTRLNSSHVEISYAVFCLKKKTIHPKHNRPPRQRGAAQDWGADGVGPCP